MIWIILTDSNRCRIYQYHTNPIQLTLINEINHPEIRLKAADFLTSDRPGHYQASGSARGAYSPHTEPKEVAIEQFMREVLKELEQGRNEQAYQQAILIAPAHISGLFLKHANKHIKKLIIENIQKDFAHMKDHELVSFLKTYTHKDLVK